MARHEDTQHRERFLVMARVHRVRLWLMQRQEHYVVRVGDFEQRHPVERGAQPLLVPWRVLAGGAMPRVCCQGLEVLPLCVRCTGCPATRGLHVLQRATQAELCSPHRRIRLANGPDFVQDLIRPAGSPARPIKRLFPT